MVGLAGMAGRSQDATRAEARYRQAIQAGNLDPSARASCSLGDLLERKGDLAGARAAWQQAIDSRAPDWAEAAFTDLVNLLERQEDADGLRAAYVTGAALDNPEALYALTQLGQVLEKRATSPAPIGPGSKPSTPESKTPTTGAKASRRRPSD
jgi:tetratricopeptide (TPR) repeat protein